MSISTYAVVQPRYSDTSSITLSLSFSSSGAVCYGKITGASGATSVSNCTATLTDSKGNVVKSWTNLSSSSSTLVFSKTASNVKKGETYTLSVTATVKRNSSSEFVSDTISKTYK